MSFNTITGTNESQAITKHIPYTCKCKFDGRKYNLYKKWNKYKYQCKSKNQIKNCVCKKRMCQSKSKNQLNNCARKKHTWNSSTWACKNDEYLRNIISDSIV